MVSKFLDLQLYCKMEFHAHSSSSSRHDGERRSKVMGLWTLGEVFVVVSWSFYIVAMAVHHDLWLLKWMLQLLSTTTVQPLR
jgi:hypothetical protein